MDRFYKKYLMNIEKLVRDPILVLGTSGILSFGIGKLFNIPVLTMIGMRIFNVIAIIGIVLLIALLFLIIGTGLHQKK
jgi:hypothetical protein